jgi:hypothetical protein
MRFLSRALISVSADATQAACNQYRLILKGHRLSFNVMDRQLKVCALRRAQYSNVAYRSDKRAMQRAGRRPLR